MSSENIHAGVIALWRNARWQGVLIEGPSGAGKSDLALRAIQQGFRLVSDDRTLLWTSGGALFGRSPGALSGQIEARGLGIVGESPLALARIALVVACAPGPEAIERLPDPKLDVRQGVKLPLLTLWPLEPGAPAKIARALHHLGAGLGAGP